MNDVIFTVGHSNTDVQTLLNLLKHHEVTAVADVRSQPYSRYLPHFSQPALKLALRDAAVHYVFLGRELGARSPDPACYVDGQARYDRIAATPLFAAGLARLQQGMARFRVALLCAEKDPLTCHRAILVCRQLRRPGLTIEHILADGRLESHQDLEQRLVQLHGLQQMTLFGPTSPADLVEEAYERQAARIAYTQTREEADEDIALLS